MKGAFIGFHAAAVVVQAVVFGVSLIEGNTPTAVMAWGFLLFSGICAGVGVERLLRARAA